MSRTATWTLSLLAGSVTLALLGLHMSFVSVSYVLLLAVAMFHGFCGLHTILTEIWPSRRAGSIIASACIALGGALFVLATVANLVY